MSVLLSCYASRQGIAYTVLRDGKQVDSGVERVSALKEHSLKTNILKAIAFGLKRVEVNHEYLTLEVQNRDVVDWLSSRKDNKEYAVLLDELEIEIEKLDCVLTVICGDCKTSRYILTKELKTKKVESTSILDIFGGLEDE
jgi:hypothetical protein